LRKSDKPPLLLELDDALEATLDAIELEELLELTTLDVAEELTLLDELLVAIVVSEIALVDALKQILYVLFAVTV
jgi:hypothetical protein